MEDREAWALLAAARSAVLATSGPDGVPTLVPICFAVGERELWTAVDDIKQKRTLRLARLANIAREPRVSVLANHYRDDDWSALWWVRADGVAAAESGPAADRAVALLADKYVQYRTRPPPGTVIRIAVTGLTAWSAA